MLILYCSLLKKSIDKRANDKNNNHLNNLRKNFDGKTFVKVYSMYICMCDLNKAYD